MCEPGCRAFHNEGHDGQNIRPKQLRNREVSWEGSHRSKLMSRRTERPYKVDGADKLAQHSAVRHSAPEIFEDLVEQYEVGLVAEQFQDVIAAGGNAGLVVFTNDVISGSSG